MIDVHCLIHKHDDKFFPLIQQQMQQEKDVCFHVVPNGDSTGAGRTIGFLQGDAPYVSYVDYDDLIEPGIFSKINAVMDAGNCGWCYTDEILIDEQGKKIQPGWSSHPQLYEEHTLEFVRVNDQYVHHILTFRREFITPKIIYIMKQLAELPEEYLRAELSQYSSFHMKEVGYYWRQHSDNSMKQFQSYKDFERIIYDQRMDTGRSEGH